MDLPAVTVRKPSTYPRHIDSGGGLSNLTDSGFKRLVVATILQALADAHDGDRQAEQWLRTEAPMWVETVGIKSEVLENMLNRHNRRRIVAEHLREWRR